MARQNQWHAQRVAFLFDVSVLKEFAQAFQKFQQKAILSSHEHRVLAQVFWAARKVESWLQLLIIFDKHARLEDQSPISVMRWQLLQMHNYNRMIRGHGLVALSCSADFYDVMDKLISFHFKPPSSSLTLRPKAIVFLLDRLTSKDLQTCISDHIENIEHALRHQHPQISALLSTGTFASDTSLLLLLKATSNKELLACLKVAFHLNLTQLPLQSKEQQSILRLAQRFIHPLFLHRLAFSSILDKVDKRIFAEEILSDKDWVVYLHENELLLLIVLLKTLCSDTACVKTLLSFLKDLNRLTPSFLVRVACQPQEYHGEYAVLIGSLEFTRALLAQSDPGFSYEIAQLALNPHYATTVCPLFTDTAITQHWTIPQVEELLIETKNYLHRNILQNLLQDKRQQLLMLKQQEDFLLSRPLPKRIASPPPLLLSPSVRLLDAPLSLQWKRHFLLQ